MMHRLLISVPANKHKAGTIFVAVHIAVIVMWLIFIRPRSPDDRAQKDHLSLSTSCVGGQDPWTNNVKAAESMTAEEIYQYLHWTNSTSCRNAVDIGSFYFFKFNGVAAPDGHKAVCFDRAIAPDMNNCLAYSFGINNEWSFDEALAKFGCHIYAFDPSMNVSAHDRSELIHFYDIGIDGENRLHPTLGWQMKTVSSINQMLASRHGASTLIDILKIDVEGAEWDAFPQMLRSGFLADKVKQLVVEIHFKTDDSLEVFRHRVQMFKDLEAKDPAGTGGFVRFSSRPNPYFHVPVQVLGNRKDEIYMDLSWYNSRFYISPAD